LGRKFSNQHFKRLLSSCVTGSKRSVRQKSIHVKQIDFKVTNEFSGLNEKKTDFSDFDALVMYNVPEKCFTTRIY